MGSGLHPRSDISPINDDEYEYSSGAMGFGVDPCQSGAKTKSKKKCECCPTLHGVLWRRRIREEEDDDDEIMQEMLESEKGMIVSKDTDSSE